MLTSLLLCFFDGLLDFIHLFLNQSLLPLCGQRDFLKLRVTDTNGIIVAGRDTAAKRFAVAGFKIFPAGDQQLCIGIEMQKLRGLLFRQVVGHNKKTFLAQTQAFGFHRSSGHFKGFAGTNFVCKQGIVTVQHMGDCVALMFP